MNFDEKWALVTRNAQEIVDEEELKKIMQGKKQPAVFLGTAITGRPHVGYFLWVIKMADFLKAGWKVKVLLADLHGALDNCPWELLDKRYDYYNLVITGMFESLGVSVKDLEFVKGSSFQLDKKYMMDVMKMASHASVRNATKAGSEVVKQSENPKLSGLLYPIFQALDEEYLDVDVQYGGVDQRKILMFAREFLPKVGYKPRVEFMTPLIPGLVGEKMSASSEESKIDLLDDLKKIQKKMNKAFCPEGEVEGNGVLAFAKHIIFVLKGDSGDKFVIERPEKFGGNVEYGDYNALEEDFVERKLHPMDLKNGVAREIDVLLAPIRKKAEGKDKLISDAYPES
ncbi:MAG: tyrosine--tRNA ligase [Candidatus Woesearchaeota archaeon]|nr:tyrosine--tRNA ligase [Candidatus Woesearchaeota archaeon]